MTKSHSSSSSPRRPAVACQSARTVLATISVCAGFLSLCVNHVILQLTREPLQFAWVCTWSKQRGLITNVRAYLDSAMINNLLA